MVHRSVLLNEILEIFDPQPGQIYIDATVNGGGHTMAILERVGSTGRVLGIDWDRDLIENLKIKKQKSKLRNLLLTCDNYANLGNIAREFHLEQVSGILFDCGFSSYHIEKSHRGFSFLKNEPLDMRYHDGGGGKNSLTAEIIVNTYSEKELADIFWNYGGERFSKRIARKIVGERRRQSVKTTAELVRIIEKAVPFGGRYHQSRHSRIHPATRVFQALRIVVNDELGNLARGLDAAVPLLKSGGRIVAISFHSLEDRIVKNFFKAEKVAERLEIITAKPLRPRAAEVRENPRSRSARVRAAQKI